jgi:hypothetical protein
MQLGQHATDQKQTRLDSADVIADMSAERVHAPLTSGAPEKSIHWKASCRSDGIGGTRRLRNWISKYCRFWIQHNRGFVVVPHLIGNSDSS